MANLNQAKLILIIPNEETHEITLTKALTSLGRRKNNDIRLPVLTVSGQHAKIERTAHGFTLTDLSRTDSAFVNGRWLQPQVPHLLTDGDELHFGQVADTAARLTFTLVAVSATDETLVALSKTGDEQEALVGVRPAGETVTTIFPSLPGQRALVFDDEDPQEKAATLEFERSLAVVIGINDYSHGIPRSTQRPTMPGGWPKFCQTTLTMRSNCWSKTLLWPA